MTPPMIDLAPPRHLAAPHGLSTEQLSAILDAARWAPSGDNGQPWRVRTSRDGLCLEVLADDAATHDFLDTNQEGTGIALGAFVEAARLAAQPLGIQCDVELLESPHEGPRARLYFDASAALVPDLLSAHLRDRVSNRRPFQAGSCSNADLDALRSAASKVARVKVELANDAASIRTLADAVALADRVRMAHRQCHEQFHEKVRWSDDEARRNPTGFYVGTFEIKPHEALLLRLTRSYSTMQVVGRLIGMPSIAASVARRQVLASGAVGLIVLPDESTPADVLRAGMALERLWLAATSRGLAFQVLGVLPMFLRRLASGGAGFGASDLGRLRQARERIGSLACQIPPDRLVLMFRVGRGPAPSARAHRLPVGAIWVENE